MLETLHTGISQHSKFWSSHRVLGLPTALITWRQGCRCCRAAQTAVCLGRRRLCDSRCRRRRCDRAGARLHARDDRLPSRCAVVPATSSVAGTAYSNLHTAHRVLRVSGVSTISFRGYRFNSDYIFTFCVSRIDDAKCIVVTRVCVSVCLSAAVRPHCCTDPDVTWRRGRGYPLVVHCWADLQSGHGLHCYDNITRTLVTSLRPSRDMTT